MHEHRADALQLAPGKPVSLLVKGSARPVTKEPLSDSQIVGLVREIAPGDLAALVTPGAQLTFAYHAPTGSIEVEMTPGAEGAGVLLRPTGPAMPAAAAAAPARDARDLSEARASMESLLRLLVESGASDLHLRSGEPPIYRRQGELARHEAAAIPGERLSDMLAAIMPAGNLAEFRETGDMDWAYEIEGVARFRCNAGNDRHGPFAVVRVIPAAVPTADALGLSREIQALCHLNKGLVLVTGPTG